MEEVEIEDKVPSIANESDASISEGLDSLKIKKEKPIILDDASFRRLEEEVKKEQAQITGEKRRHSQTEIPSGRKSRRSTKTPVMYSEEDFDENGKVERWLFYAPEAPELVEYIEGKRYHPQTRTFIKIFIDGGQSWLKLCMTIEKVQDDLASPGKRKTRSSYKDGVLPQKFKDSGVKKGESLLSSTPVVVFFNVSPLAYPLPATLISDPVLSKHIVFCVYFSQGGNAVLLLHVLNA